MWEIDVVNAKEFYTAMLTAQQSQAHFHLKKLSAIFQEKNRPKEIFTTHSL
jgi:hypothetical protein